MSSPTTASELSRIINQLRIERQAHLDAISEIDHTFKDFGIAAAGEAAAPKAAKAKAEPAPAPAAEAAPAPAAPAAAAKGKKKGAAKGAKSAKSAKPAKAAAKPAAKPAKPAKAPKEAKAAKAAEPAKAAAAPRRGKFAISGEQLILDFVKAKGGATTEEIRKHWQAAGRKGKAENKLTDLVKSGQIKRNKVKGKIGSTYTLP